MFAHLFAQWFLKYCKTLTLLRLALSSKGLKILVSPVRFLVAPPPKALQINDLDLQGFFSFGLGRGSAAACQKKRRESVSKRFIGFPLVSPCLRKSLYIERRVFWLWQI